jgi:hypothetical protein
MIKPEFRWSILILVHRVRPPPGCPGGQGSHGAAGRRGGAGGLRLGIAESLPVTVPVRPTWGESGPASLPVSRSRCLNLLGHSESQRTKFDKHFKKSVNHVLLKLFLLLCFSLYSADFLTAITSFMGQFLTFLASLDFFLFWNEN